VLNVPKVVKTLGNAFFVRRFVPIVLVQKEDFRKIGINFITAGVVGVFINHYVGLDFSTMFWASLSITALGMLSLTLGLLRRNK
jgi:hypothetical protein